MGDADLGRFDDPLVDVLALAVGGALQRVERAADVGLAPLRLVGGEARDVLAHTLDVGPLGRPAVRTTLSA